MYQDDLTDSTRYATEWHDIRCPWCGRLQFRARGLTDEAYIQRKCDRCRRFVEVIGSVVIASVSNVRQVHIAVIR